MKHFISLVLVGLLGLGLGIQLGSPEGQIQIAGRIGPPLESLLIQDGHAVVHDGGVTRIEGDKTQLGNSLSIALERELLKAETHRENIENFQVAGYKKKLAVVGAGQAPYLQDSHTQGSLHRTDYPFHVAINGVGFFPIQLTEGKVAYTRAGDFRYDGRTQQLTTSAGHSLGIKIPDHYYNIEISPRGEVSGKRLESFDGQPEVLGSLKLVAFDCSSNLSSLSGGLYEERPEAGARREGRPGDVALGLGVLVQGHLEKANVDFDYEAAELSQSERRCAFLARCLTSLRPELISY